MTDRELLELAAKAAGLDVEFWPLSGANIVSGLRPGLWRPLDDDGDALRTAVKLGFTVAIKGHECEVFDEDGDCLASVPIMGAPCFLSGAEATNPYAATRRAIVRAAAAIGQAMP